MRMICCTAVFLALAAPLLAGQAPRVDNDNNSHCDRGPPQRPATPPARGSDSGTAPGGMGSTGWSGGTGGSHIGTSPSGGTPASPDRQPATTQGLDPTRPSGTNRTAPC